MKIRILQLTLTIPTRTILISTRYFLKFYKTMPQLNRRFSEETMPLLLNRELRKEIYKRSRLRNNFWKDQSKENQLLFQTQRNKYVSLRRKRIKPFFQGVKKTVLLQISRSENSLDHFWPTKTVIHKMI